MMTLKDLFGNEALTWAQLNQRLQSAPPALRALTGETPPQNGFAAGHIPQGANGAGNGGAAGFLPPQGASYAPPASGVTTGTNGMTAPQGAGTGMMPPTSGAVPQDAFLRGLQTAMTQNAQGASAPAAAANGAGAVPHSTGDAQVGNPQAVQNPQGYAQLQAAYNDLAARYQADLDHVKLDSAIDSAISAAGAKNPVAVRALLDPSSLRLVNGQAQGLAEQLALLRQREPYLFQQSAPQDAGDSVAIATGGRHGTQGGAPLDRFLTAAMAAAGI